jgi:hypothetical protein
MSNMSWESATFHNHSILNAIIAFIMLKMRYRYADGSSTLGPAKLLR